MIDQMLGSWSGPFEKHQYQITLNPDATFETRNTRFSWSEKGTYQFAAPVLTMKYDGAILRWRLVSCDANNMELHSDEIGGSIRFTRTGN